jgi:hypothetical protein
MDHNGAIWINAPWRTYACVRLLKSKYCEGGLSTYWIAVSTTGPLIGCGADR